MTTPYDADLSARKAVPTRKRKTEIVPKGIVAAIVFGRKSREAFLSFASQMKQHKINSALIVLPHGTVTLSKEQVEYLVSLIHRPR